MASAVAQIGPASKSSKVTRQQQSQCRGFWKIGLPCAARSLPQYWYSCWAHLPPDGYREVWRGDPGIMKPSPIGKTLTLILRLHIRWQPLLGASKVGPLKHQRVNRGQVKVGPSLHANGEPVRGAGTNMRKNCYLPTANCANQALLPQSRVTATFCQLSHRCQFANSSIFLTHVFGLLPALFARGCHSKARFAHRLGGRFAM